MAATSANAQAIWFRRMLGEIGEVQSTSTTIYCNGKNTIQLAKNTMYPGRSKQVEFEISFH